ncbi:hypothetical protein PFICI_03265 [Pestalotiopsis fici W106-1]|uniref:Uncharacterized protein n=1 Tax=Pestalotiopsis fici (strain W106-1 / CGMCC3.15140) TaxID=1229662 RepID=W3XGU6_PESFW|nr:uncharacterized protein PFICI_03265 [Pestalotiopsis fici W106-1]ETS85240.1 hypothetical protein PFICI_03265 [Pestalotiopsis fici W106-1]
MSGGSSSPNATPAKRKRDDVIFEHMSSNISAEKVLTAPVFTFEPPSLSQNIVDDGSSSPRTRVANKFRDLSLERSGGGVRASPSPDGIASEEPALAADVPRQHAIEHSVFDFNAAVGKEADAQDMQQDQDESSAIRKRLKHCNASQESPLMLSGEISGTATDPMQSEESGKVKLDTSVDPSMIGIARSLSIGGLKKSYPSINRLADSKSRGRKRAGTPPRRKVSDVAEEAEAVVVDPVRAALTWHEDEITVYDSEDKDDDGTGLNGIGFRPTPAIAYQRAQKRKKQLSEYKKREESEARALRNQKRRELLGEAEDKRRQSIVRVRFSDANPETLETS